MGREFDSRAPTTACKEASDLAPRRTNRPRCRTCRTCGANEKTSGVPGQCVAKLLGLPLPEMLRLERETVAATAQKRSCGSGEVRCVFCLESRDGGCFARSSDHCQVSTRRSAGSLYSRFSSNADIIETYRTTHQDAHLSLHAQDHTNLPTYAKASPTPSTSNTACNLPLTMADSMDCFRNQREWAENKCLAQYPCRTYSITSEV
jgi:hypothetical protein